MSMTTLTFLLAVAVAALIAGRLPRPRHNQWLLLLSILFCAAWSGRLLLFLLGVTLINHFLGRRVRDPAGQQPRRGWLRLGVLLNLASLVVFKYTRFFFPEFRGLLADIGLEPQLSFGLSVVMVLGLSYVALQGIAYLVDVAHGRVAPASLPDLALYLIYFPKLLAGPIERPASFLNQLTQPHPVNIGRSAGQIGVGLFRKLVIADSLALVIPANGWQVWNGAPAVEVVVWLMLYSFMLYNDFAGYTDIARGVSGLFGIELTPNFRQPYFARNLTEYWDRYHITLSHWLRDYIYLPLSLRLRQRAARRAERRAPAGAPFRPGLAYLALPPLLTMAASGLWHGLSPNMLIWGLLHGLYLFVERWRRGDAATPPDAWPRWRQLVGMARVYLLTVVAFAFFRLDLLFTLDVLRPPSPFTLSLMPGLWVLAPVFLSLWLDKVEATGLPLGARWPEPVRAVGLALALLLIVAASLVNAGPPFIYQGF